MFRYFVELKQADNLIIQNQDVHHIKNVVKLKLNEQIECVYQDLVYQCTISDLSSNDQVIVKINHQLVVQNSLVKKVLLAGILREQKWDYLLQKATELGVDLIVPVIFKRNVVKIEQSKYVQKQIRWQTICDNAAKQAKRTTIPVVQPIVNQLSELEQYLSQVNLVAWEDEHHQQLWSYLHSEFNSISFVIGCEGGLEAQEVVYLQKLGFNPVSLGRNILRAETAPLYVLACLNYENK